MKKYELIPTTGQKSFYGKAIVVADNNGNETLYSYNTPIIKRDKSGNLERLYAGWSQTTGKHVKAFCGLDKKGFFALPHEMTTFEKAKAYSGTLYI